MWAQGNYSCCELMNAMAVLSLENDISQTVTLSNGSCVLPAPVPVSVFPVPELKADVYMQHVAHF